MEEAGKKYWHIAKLGCKSWNCPQCGPKKASKFRHAIIQQASERQMNRFATLTLDPKACDVRESTKYVRESWRKLRIYLKRKYRVTVPFIAVLEHQKSGYAHLHVLLDRYVPQAWLQESWQAVGGGRFVNIKFVDLHRIAAYLSKYLTKDLILGGHTPGTRRYSTSRDIHLFAKPERGKWLLLKLSIDLLYDMHFGLNPEPTVDANGEITSFRVMMTAPQ